MDKRFYRAFASSRSPTLTMTGSRRRRNCSMANRRGPLLLGVLITVACGCASVGNVHTADSQQPAAVTTEEAQKLRADGLALYDQQPRGLTTITSAAHQLEQAARALRDDYGAQWQAAQAQAFLAENETRPEIRLDAARRGVV